MRRGFRIRVRLAKSTRRALTRASGRIASPSARIQVMDRFEAVNKSTALWRQVREGAGKDGGWCLDFHTELDMRMGRTG